MIQALFGGVLIGLGSLLLMFTLGRIAGISAIVGRVFEKDSWRVVFLFGLIIGALLVGQSAIVAANASLLHLSIAGVLVGVGTTLANGCTSGHGVCGNARLSIRSLVATLTFMAFGILTVALI
jgi:uncharacterized protein